MSFITVLIKPSSSACNMGCKYCFYRDVANNRHVQNFGIMKKDITKILIKRTIDYIGNNGTVNFAFQGGEPTLCGIEYFQYFVNQVNEIKKEKNINVNYSIQTNGLLIDEDLAQFFKENKFLVGLSLDGPSDIHDILRIDNRMNPTHARVMNAANILNKYNVDFNILCVVTKQVAQQPHKAYNFFKSNNFRFIQYIPLIDEFNSKESNTYSLSSQDYENFLKHTFDYWFQDFMSNDGVSIRFFDNIVDILLGINPEMCSIQGRCSINIVVESNGNVYSCDFYVLDKYLIGNVKENSFKEIMRNPNGIRFVKESMLLNEECLNCEFLFLCRSGCRRYKEPIENGRLKQNRFCSAYKSFFKYSLSRFESVIEKIKNNYY